MTKRTMSLARFASILDAYGAAPSRWPAAERAAAEALVRRLPEARVMLETAAELDRILDAAEAPAPSEALRAAVLEAAPRPERHAVPAAPRRLRGGLLRPGGGWRAAATALAASFLLGVAAGGAIARIASVEAGMDLLQLALLDDGFSGD